MLTRISVYCYQCSGHLDTYFEPYFSSFTWKTGGVWMCKLGMISQELLKTEIMLLLSANRKSFMPCLLAQQWMTLSDLEWHRTCFLFSKQMLAPTKCRYLSFDQMKYSVLDNASGSITAASEVSSEQLSQTLSGCPRHALCRLHSEFIKAVPNQHVYCSVS